MAPRKGSVNWRRKYPWEDHPIEVRHFVYMQKRVSSGYCKSAWPRTTKGFYAFLKSTGPCPKFLLRPSLGRKNHLKGYQPGNCKWQEYRENSAEPSQRKGFRQEKSSMMKSRWSDPKYKKRMTDKAKREALARTRTSIGTFAPGASL